MSCICKYCKKICKDDEDLYNHIRTTSCKEKHRTSFSKVSKKSSGVVKLQSPALQSPALQSPALSEDSITFGKYKDLTLPQMLRDRNYCEWLLKQEWFPKQYEYIYNKVKQYEPQKIFVIKPALEEKDKEIMGPETFLHKYPYFNLCPLDDVKIPLSDIEKTCYSFYLQTIEDLKGRIRKIQSFDIKAPTSWLMKFEKASGISREVFKEFINAYELPNIPYIIEDIKKMGGITYLGAKSYIIAKEKSLKQEKFWEDILKKIFGEDIGTQFKFKNCIFDFIHIKSGTLYECKLNLKDFNETQHTKYLASLGEFKLVYLIDTKCIIDIDKRKIYITDEYEFNTKGVNAKFLHLLCDFRVIQLDNVETYFK
jgi:hypothetical protein